MIRTPNTGKLNPLFQTFAEGRPIVNRVVARQSTDWLAANALFSPNDRTLCETYIKCTMKTFVINIAFRNLSVLINP